MVAGASARVEAQRSLISAEEYERLARDARTRAVSFEIAATSEEAVGRELTALTELGWTVLADRRWGRRSNIDLLLVGPAGVFIADVKHWASLEVINNSIFRSGECCDDELEKNLRLSDDVADALRELEITPSSVRPVLVFHGRELEHTVQGVKLIGTSEAPRWLARQHHRFDDETVAAVTAVLEERFPPHHTEETLTEPAVVAPRRIVIPRRKRARPEAAQTTPEESHPATTSTPTEPTLFDVDSLADALLQSALAGPIEDWMTFLHPDQLKLVSVRHKGPARVRGAAGTGKTVVGLHRAAHLARTADSPIHFVTFVRTLPVVLRNLATRLTPDHAERIRFTGLHALAKRVLTEANVPHALDTGRTADAFARAWSNVGRGSILEALDKRPAYWQEEIDHVIKGRGITDFADYAALSRTGRRTRLARSHREVMWDLYAAYANNLSAARTHDFNDWLIMATDLIREEKVSVPCGGVIVDEVQDLTLVGLAFLHALAGDGPDRLLIIGDGQQSIYPGGFTLTEAGIDIRGRSTVLEVNYRNTTEILAAATRVISGDPFEDMDGVSEAGTRAIDVRRRGSAPLFESFPTHAALDSGVLTRLAHLRDTGSRPGDCAVLCLTLREVGRFRDLLRARGIPAETLSDYAGKTNEHVKVGTIKRAKGLEFAHVLLPVDTESDPPQWSGEGEDAYLERVERHRREIFVAMTRARDTLWAGRVLPV